MDKGYSTMPGVWGMQVQQRCVTLCGDKGRVGAWAAEQEVDDMCHPAQEMMVPVKGVHGFYNHQAAPWRGPGRADWDWIGGTPLKGLVVRLLSGANSGGWAEDSSYGSWRDEEGRWWTREGGHWLENRVLRAEIGNCVGGQPVDIENGLELRLSVVGEWANTEQKMETSNKFSKRGQNCGKHSH